MLKKRVFSRGFTLIEILVVVAIIGILASVILVSLTGARSRARDARRVSDMNSIRNALEIYFGANNRYPTANEFALVPKCEDSGAGVTPKIKCLYPTYIPSMPTDPFTNTEYQYVGLKMNFPGSGDKCLSYAIGAPMEDTDAGSSLLKTDSDPASAVATANVCLEGGIPFSPIDCTDGSTVLDEASEKCYSLSP